MAASPSELFKASKSTPTLEMQSMEAMGAREIMTVLVPPSYMADTGTTPSYDKKATYGSARSASRQDDLQLQDHTAFPIRCLWD